MSAIATLPVTPTAWTATLRQAWRDRSGFVWLAPGETVRPAFPMLDGAPPSERDGWHRHLHDQIDHAPDLGVQIFPAGRIAGPGYAFVDNRLVLHDSYLPEATHGLLPNQPYWQAANLDQLEAINLAEPVVEILGPGSHVYGHWLLDFLPRAIVAREVLGEAFETCRFAFPENVPGWALTMLTRLTGFNPAQLVRYDPLRHYVEATGGLISPTYGRRSTGFMHSLIREAYAGLHPKAPKGQRRLLCLSRSSLGKESTRERSFEQAEFLDQAAAARGFEIVHPQSMSFEEQLALYASAGAIVGEHGSALLNALFAPHGCILGCISFTTPDISRIGALCAQRNIYLIPEDGDEGVDEHNIGFSRVSEANIEIFLDAILRHYREGLID